MTTETILVLGSQGQIGPELTTELRRLYGRTQVISSDITVRRCTPVDEGPFIHLDAMDTEALQAVTDAYRVTQIYALASNPQCLLNVLELARERRIKVFWPSSIAVFGPGAPRLNCPEDAVLDPTTIFGISKFAGERSCAYYADRYGVDVRSLRYPGLITHRPGQPGGITDFARDMFRNASTRKPYTCYLSPHTQLPVLYQPDAIRATIELMEAPAHCITPGLAYNIAAFSLSPAQLATAIQSYAPDFRVTYTPDLRQRVAETSPQTIDDTRAQADWGWESEYGLTSMTRDIFRHLGQPTSVPTMTL